MEVSDQLHAPAVLIPGLGACMGVLVKKFLHFLCRDSNPGHPTLSLVTIRFESSNIAIQCYM